MIASLVGTYRVLEPQDAQQINSFIIYKFRGDPALFDAGLADISRRTGWTSFGVVPWLSEVSKLIFSELQARGVKVTIITNSLAANNHATVHGGYAEPEATWGQRFTAGFMRMMPVRGQF